ncbi:MAG: proteasome assembly chaperone family protein [Methermicoccaceae archaeon]
MSITVIPIKEISPENPTLIEGLPGVGHVGKLVAEHMVDKLEAEHVSEIYSHYFPPQVIVEEDSTIRLVKNDIYYKRVDGKDILILVGDYQSTTTEGHYELCNLVLDMAERMNVKQIYTLGGYGVGHLVEEEWVLGAMNDASMREQLEGAGVIFKPNEPPGGIVGISGLLLGLAKERGIPAACLMGVTSGYMIDPKSARAVLKVLTKLLGIEVDTEELDKRAKEMEGIVAKVREIERAQIPPELKPSDDELRYIG